jgi:2-polyprenyl-3-methyl-5-hydroxy-6-metoxy-1,4-benzoquinol methylase
MLAINETVFDSGPYAKKYGAAQRNRLNERHKRIIAANIGHIAGKRVLDLAAHDGRWTWAALQAGAAYVEAVEGRAELVAEAEAALTDVCKERVRIFYGDIFTHLERAAGPFDTVLCLGLFYHIDGHFRLLRLISRLKPQAIILDTALEATDERIIAFAAEKTDRRLNAIADEQQSARAIVGIMSRGLLEYWCRLNRWHLSYVPWNRSEIKSRAALNGYLDSRNRRGRFTFVLSR